MKTLHKLSSGFFTKHSARFVFNISIEDKNTPVCEKVEIEGTTGITMNLAALKEFPDIAVKIDKALKGAGENRFAMGGIFFPSSIIFDLEKIRQHEMGGHIEVALQELENAVAALDTQK